MSSAPTAPLGELPDLAAERHGSTAFISDEPWRCYGRPVVDVTGFAEAVHDYADRLWAAGVRHGDTVAVIQRSHIEVQALACGLSRIGALPVLLSAGNDPNDLIDRIALFSQPHVVLDATGWGVLRGYREQLRRLASRVHYLAPEGASDGELTGEDPLLAPAQDRSPHQAKPRDEDEWAVITHSSGTTGVPKLAAHSTRSLYGMVEVQIALARQYTDTELSAKHLTFVHARMCSVVLGFLEAAMPLLAVMNPGVEHVRRLFLEHRPASVETHPNVYRQWEPLASHPSRPFSTVHRFISTFDAMHPGTIRTLLSGSDNPDAHYIQGYGQTETGAVTVRLVTRAEAASYRPRNVGRAVHGAQIRIVDESGQPVSAGKLGYIECKAPGQFCGYVGSPPRTAGEWWPMGDVGRLTGDGSLELLDRTVDHQAQTDSLLEKEDTLLDLLPELMELVLVPPAEGGELTAVACVRPEETLGEARFRAAAAKVGIADIPLHLCQWDDLPLTASYKVRRNELRARLQTGSLQRRPAGSSTP